VAAVDPARLVAKHVERRGDTLRITLGRGRSLVRRIDRLWVAGAGKAAEAMAAAIAQLAPEVRGIVIAPRRKGARRARRVGGIQVLAGEHPVPGPGSFGSTARLVRALRARPKHDTVLFLLSGGASALLAAPAPGVTRSDKAALNRHLLRCGAPIEVMNVVRKHVSAVKGGGLAVLAAPCEVLTLALSDVPGDALATIGSGPTVTDPSTFAQALAALRATDPTGTAVPPRIWRRLEAGTRRDGPQETPKAADPRLRRSLLALLGTNRTALAAAARAARRHGYAIGRPCHLDGEAAGCGRALVAALPAVPQRPLCVLAGGETHVDAGQATGKGGRCQELALAAAAVLKGGRWSLLCAGTDGIDGQTDAAGAFCDGRTIARGGRRSASRALQEHDAYTFFADLDDLFRPGPTGTNVMDIAIALHPGAQRSGRVPPG
jgi:hydroxypyruvate reductase